MEEQLQGFAWQKQMRPISHNPSKCLHLTNPAILESHKISPFVSSTNWVLNTFGRAAVRAVCLPNGFVTLKNDWNNLFIVGLPVYLFYFFKYVHNCKFAGKKLTQSL